MSATQFRLVGASNHTDKEREVNDYYATPPEAIDYLLAGGAELSMIYGNVLAVGAI